MAESSGQVIACHTIESWNQQIHKANESKKLIVVDFTASWCGPCRFIAPEFEEIAGQVPNVMFLKVDVDELKTVAGEWEVEAMPTFIFVKESKLLDKIAGANKRKLQETAAKHAASDANVAA